MCKRERESQRKKELSELKERASQRKNDPNADPLLRSKRRFRHEPNANPATKQTPIQSAKQMPISSHSGHTELTSLPILHGSPITEL